MDYADDSQAGFCEHRLRVVQSGIHKYRPMVVGPWREISVRRGAALRHEAAATDSFYPRRSREFISCLKGIWTQEKFTFKGDFYQASRP